MRDLNENENPVQDDNKLKEIHQRIIQQITGNMKYYGFQDTIGYVIAMVYYSSNPVSLDELSEKTSMSKTRMSQVARDMTKINIAEKTPVKNSRKDFYRIESDYYKVFISLITSNLRNLVIRNKKIDQDIKDSLEKILDSENISREEIDLTKSYLSDTKESMRYFQWMDRFVDFLESGEIFKHVKPKE